MKRDELYAKYIGVMNINAVLKQQNAELLKALKRIEVIGRGARPEISKGALAGDIARAAIAKAEGE